MMTPHNTPAIAPTKIKGSKRRPDLRGEASRTDCKKSGVKNSADMKA
jgi:hypothetical protein